jgi:Rad3-related DNA helicase
VTEALTKKRLTESTTPAPDFFDIASRPSLPVWLDRIRPHQWTAVESILAAYERGTDVVFLDAPTGSGKTLIAELVSRLLNLRTLYVCSDKSLQEQFIRDYPYAKLLKGRANYPTLDFPFPRYNAGDCDKTRDRGCHWCDKPGLCPYEIAKREAHTSPIATVNTSYLLHEANYVGGFSNMPFVVADECDTLENALMGFVEFFVSKQLLKRLEIHAPRKGVHKATIVEWIEDKFIPAATDHMGNLSTFGPEHIEYIRRARSLQQKIEQAKSVIAEFDDNWVRDNSLDGTLVLKPVTVNKWGREYLWRHGQKWLCMSASIISPDEMADSLGLDEVTENHPNPLTWEMVEVPSTFPVRHRPVIMVPAADMTKKAMDEDPYTLDKMAGDINTIAEANPEENVLVHTHSYKNATDLASKFKGTHKRITYKDAVTREEAITRIRSEKSVIVFAPSFVRGVDLVGDMCRVGVIAKVPYPYLGDRQVSARMHTRLGNMWYTVQTVRSILQMTGRMVRNRNDWAVCFILDSNFIKFWKKAKRYFPKWWVDAFRMERPPVLKKSAWEIVHDD